MVTMTRSSGVTHSRGNKEDKVTLSPSSRSKEEEVMLTASREKKPRPIHFGGTRLKVRPSPSTASRERKLILTKEMTHRCSDLDNIRNVTIIAPSGNDKSRITEFLVKAGTFCSPEVSHCDLEKTESHASHTENGLLIKSSDQSVCYNMSTEQFKWSSFNEVCTNYMLNLFNPPAPANVSPEATPSFVLPDGALVLIDALDGLSGDAEILLRRGIVERVKPVYCINIPGQYFLNLPSDGEEGYEGIFNCIKEANLMLQPLNDKLIGDVQIRPEKGTAAFWCGEFGWAFTLTGMAKFYAPMFGIDAEKLREKMWGDHFYDTESKIWTSKNTGSSTCKRGFILLCYEPIMKILEFCKKRALTKLRSVLKRLDVELKVSDEGLRNPQHLLKRVMEAWLPAGPALADMIFSQLPSPQKAQSYRLENLYDGPMNDRFAMAIRKCDPTGPLMMYISEPVASSESMSKLFALGRIFSGQLTHGMKVQLLGVSHSPLNCFVWINKQDKESAQDNNCGRVICLLDVDHPMDNVTVTSFDECNACAIRPSRICMLPSVRIIDQDDVTLEAASETRHERFYVTYRVYNELYLHQREALIWLWSIHCQETGAILADDMGLGKTREVAVFLAGLVHSNLITRALIIVPATVVNDWEETLEMVGLHCNKCLGAKDSPILKCVKNIGGVLLTSYDSYRLHVSEHEIDWDYLFLDEGHRIKNTETKIYKSLQCISSCHKIIITGTPVQNNLMEFYTLMDFCNPGLLGSIEYFKKNFINPIGRGKYRDAKPVFRRKYSTALKVLTEMIQPFLLRRTKQLLKEQGRLNCDKNEILVWIELTHTQIELYKTLVQHENEMIYEKGEPLLTALVAECVCNHPELLLNACPEEASASFKEIKDKLLAIYDNDVLRREESSSKLSFLTSLVSNLLEEKHKILIFSQSPRMLLIIERTLAKFVKEGSMVRMDGSTPRQQRKELIEQFQASPTSPPLIFLMTTKVGGVGVTLTQASRVIIFDPSKNPIDDDQSVDRAYRIGQNNDVLVYRLVAGATIEEHRYRKKILKGETSCGVLGGQLCRREITKLERNVLTLPPCGFHYCQTQQELATTHGDRTFHSYLRLDLDQIKRNKNVLGLTNHTRLFSVKEKYIDEEAQSRSKKIPGPRKDKKILGCTSINVNLIIEVPQFIVPHLSANQFRGKRQIEMRSGAVINLLMKAEYPEDQQQVQIFGTSVEIEKARRLLDDFIHQLKHPIDRVKIYVPLESMVGLLIGLKEIQDASGAQIERLPPDKYHHGKRGLEISGRQEQIKMAQEMIMEKAARKRGFRTRN